MQGLKKFKYSIKIYLKKKIKFLFYVKNRKFDIFCNNGNAKLYNT